MTAPSVTERADPGATNTYNKMLENGYRTLIAFSLDTDISFWEKSVTPPPLDVGDPIDITTMHNDTWKTKAAPALADTGVCTTTVAYDPDVYNQILAIMGTVGEFTVHLPDESTLSFWGYLQKFEPAELVNGTFPEATITIVPTNYDRANGTEEAMVLTPTVGT
jgi:hypothetical protein